jgi:hypothetical protein
MPVPTGFFSKMPMKTAGEFFRGGKMREIFTRRA